MPEVHHKMGPFVGSININDGETTEQVVNAVTNHGGTNVRVSESKIPVSDEDL